MSLSDVWNPPCLFICYCSTVCVCALCIHILWCVNFFKASVNLFVHRFVTVRSVIISRVCYSNYCCGTIAILTNAHSSGLQRVYVSGGGCTYSLSQFFGSSAWSHWEWMQTCLSPPQGWKQQITKKCLHSTSLSKIEPLSGGLLHAHCQPTASCPVACFPQKTRHTS